MTSGACVDGVGRVTAVLASFNQRQYIQESLTSLLAQTRGFDEVLVIDDTSTDDSVDLVRALAQGRPEVAVRVNEHNAGVAYVNNLGLQLASGDYIGFFASDDVYHVELVERLAGALERNPGAALACGYDEWIDEGGKTIEQLRRVRPKASEFYTGEEAERYFSRYGSFLSGCACLYRTSSLRDIGGFDSELGPFQDAYARERLAIAHGMCFVPQVLGYWRRTSMSFSSREGKSCERMLVVVGALEQRLGGDSDCTTAELPMSPGYRRRLLNRYRYFALSTLLGQECLGTEEVHSLVGGTWRAVSGLIAKFSHHRRPMQLLIAMLLVPGELLGDIQVRLRRRVLNR